MISTGIRGTGKWTVTEEMTAKNLGSGEMEVLGTPALISWIEATAWKSLRDYLEPGWTTVGTKLEISHLSPTPVGMNARCETEVIQVDRRRVVFRAEVFDEAGKVGEGIHKRFMVQKETFLRKAMEKAADRQETGSAGPEIHA